MERRWRGGGEEVGDKGRVEASACDHQGSLAARPPGVLRRSSVGASYIGPGAASPMHAIHCNVDACLSCLLCRLLADCWHVSAKWTHAYPPVLLL